jgi:hypothetical protein
MSETPLSNQEPAMPEEQSSSHDVAAGDPAVPAEELAYEPVAEDDDWLDEPAELPRRPRRRLLGAGGNPITLALLGVLLLACGFIGGVLVEKGQTSTSTGGSTSGLASRFAALRGAGGTAATGGGATGSASSGSGASSTHGGFAGGGGGFAGGGFAGRGGFGGAGAAGATIGEVSFIGGNTLYVTNSEGNTVKVTTSPASSITKTVKADVHSIHPGETVVVRGTKSSGGAVSAESVSVTAAAGGSGAGGGLGALFGG